MRLDIRVMHRRGLLWAGGSNAWNWNSGGEHAGSVRFTVDTDSMRLTYNINEADASQIIATTTTPCAYGGSRSWFSCPLCGGRIAVLYMRSGRFACRSCQRISYTSQTGSERARLYAKYHRLRALVDAGKPKWQRWATFNRLEDRLARADERALGCLALVVERFIQNRTSI